MYTSTCECLHWGSNSLVNVSFLIFHHIQVSWSRGALVVNTFFLCLWSGYWKSYVTPTLYTSCLVRSVRGPYDHHMLLLSDDMGVQVSNTKHSVVLLLFWRNFYLNPCQVTFCWTHVKWQPVEEKKIIGAGSQMFIKTVMVWSIACYYHSQAFPPRFLLFFFFPFFFSFLFFWSTKKKAEVKCWLRRFAAMGESLTAWWESHEIN